MLDIGLTVFYALVSLKEIPGTLNSHFPEPTLSILQMALVMAFCLWAAARFGSRLGRHFGILMVLAFIVMNICFLDVSIWGDYPGETLWGVSSYNPNDYENYNADSSAYKTAQETWRASAFYISADVYALVWAIFLVASAILAAFTNRPGLMRVNTFMKMRAAEQV